MIESAAVIGLGLIGGSLARDLAAKGVHVFAGDRDEAAVRAAAEQGIARPLTWNEPVDVVVLAAPVVAARELPGELAGRMEGVRLITDVGSTKRSIVDAAEQLGIGDRFVGSHPLAGDHRSGWDASRTGLFVGAPVYLSPCRSTDADAVELARELWTMVGAVPEVMDAAEHDRRLAWTSHLPQAASTALSRALAAAGIARSDLGPGGRDVTRLAGSSPEVWADILADNADEVLPALDALEVEMRGLRQAVASGDRDRLRQFLASGREWHAQHP
ncbi:MAG TPA: prephenate dehydrogenase/arogenate dehydrogenase family protein [Longimicrobium sp.]|jgi:prephenate dehydrogenase|uniref:prephenate dehydrogenase n=1 Tax=Longimicrobium sp. TaxID=2029185 RepID=UPI002ED80DEA